MGEEEEVLELKYQLDAVHSKLSVLHNINKSLSNSRDEVRASLQISLAERRGLEKDNLKLKRISEDLKTSADDFKERNVSLQKINANLFKIEEMQGLKIENLENVNMEVQRSVDKDLDLAREHEKLRKLDEDKINKLETFEDAL